MPHKDSWQSICIAGPKISVHNKTSERLIIWQSQANDACHPPMWDRNKQNTKIKILASTSTPRSQVIIPANIKNAQNSSLVSTV